MKIIFNFYSAIEVCHPDTLRRFASVYHDLLSHEKSLDFLIDLLQKDRILDSISLNALDKTITFYEVMIIELNIKEKKRKFFFSFVFISIFIEVI